MGARLVSLWPTDEQERCIVKVPREIGSLVPKAVEHLQRILSVLEPLRDSGDDWDTVCDQIIASGELDRLGVDPGTDVDSLWDAISDGDPHERVIEELQTLQEEAMSRVDPNDPESVILCTVSWRADGALEFLRSIGLDKVLKFR